MSRAERIDASPMDLEQVLAAAKDASVGAGKIIDVAGVGTLEYARADLEEAAEHLAHALYAVLAWDDRRDGEANQLLGALGNYLP
ncbi:hypothetical protein [Phenylobacterium sp.]|uniref:hypothetical protein n=1 Tax=Phenylobacterium sp. TaxID=1871053 RepID=UPI002DF4B991|nr:hypothetical protein [Phenylobacterium sp.]